jgi:hypothetical protein
VRVPATEQRDLDRLALVKSLERSRPVWRDVAGDEQDRLQRSASS